MGGMDTDSETTCVWSLPPDVSASLVIDTIPDGLIVLDANCRVRQWNRAMEQLSGYSAETMLGQSYASLDFRDPVSGESLLQERQCLRSGEPDPRQVRELDCTLRHADGGTVPVRKAGRVIVDSDGAAVGILLVLTDQRPLRRLQEQLALLESFDGTLKPPGRLVGAGPAMQAVYRKIRMAGPSEATVLITGETGTGKERVAEAIHAESPRRDKPLVKVTCSALSEHLLESELFGHVKGAFTGALRDSAGRIEAAEEGTLFLDEIGDLTPAIQLKLLRLLQERQYERVGDARTRTADVRFIAATHRDIKALIAAGRFREDLYYRIHVYPIEVPALREHKEDIPLLCGAFIDRLNRRTGKRIRDLSSEASHCLMDFCWPGNVRQLENALEHAFVSCAPPQIVLEDLPLELRSAHRRNAECRRPAMAEDAGAARRAGVTRDALREALEETRWNQSEAARRLGVDRTTVWRQMRRWNLANAPEGERRPWRTSRPS